MAVSGLHISISAEKLFSFAGVNFTNSMLTSVIVSGLLIAFALWVRFSLRDTQKPTGVQNFAEWLVESLVNLVHGVTNSKKKTDQFFPIVASFFLFILLNNWLGLLPGSGTIGFYDGEDHVALAPSSVGANVGHFVVNAATPAHETAPTTSPIEGEPTGVMKKEEPVAEHGEEAKKEFVPFFRAGTADLNTTLALGMTSIIIVQFFGFSYQGLGYLKKYFNFSNPINAFVGILELVSELSRILSFAFRLFGNVFAGEVLLAVLSALIPVIVPMPFYGMELFVGFIQALVFAMLSAVFFNMATLGHDDH
jgi:F-type H+-transporting ATPase subunit a